MAAPTVRTATAAREPRRRARAILLVRGEFPVQLQTAAAVAHLRARRYCLTGIAHTRAGALAFVASGGADVVLTLRTDAALAGDVRDAGGRVEYLRQPPYVGSPLGDAIVRAARAGLPAAVIAQRLDVAEHWVRRHLYSRANCRRCSA